MEDINAYEYGLLQEQDNKCDRVKDEKLNDKLARYISVNLLCNKNCPLNSDGDCACIVASCRERFMKFFETGA